MYHLYLNVSNTICGKMVTLEDIISRMNTKELLIFVAELGLSVPGGSKAKKDDILALLKQHFAEKGTSMEDLEKNEKLKKIIDEKSDFLSTLSKDELYSISKNLRLLLWGGSKAKKDSILMALREYPNKGRIDEEIKIILEEKEKKKLRVQATKEDIQYLDKRISDLALNVSDLITHSEEMGKQLAKTHDLLQKLDELSKLHLSKFENSFTIESLKDFIRAFQEEKNKHDLIGPDTFDAIRDGLKNRGYTDVDLIKYGGLLSLLGNLIEVTKRVDWGVDINIFYAALTEEFKKLKKQLSVVPIPDLRERVSKRLDINPEKFDMLLLQCRKNGWVRLEAGRPIGEKEVKHLVSPDGKSYYYVELLKTI